MEDTGCGGAQAVRPLLNESYLKPVVKCIGAGVQPAPVKFLRVDTVTGLAEQAPHGVDHPLLVGEVDVFQRPAVGHRSVGSRLLGMEERQSKPLLGRRGHRSPRPGCRRVCLRPPPRCGESCAPTPARGHSRWGRCSAGRRPLQLIPSLASSSAALLAVQVILEIPTRVRRCPVAPCGPCLWGKYRALQGPGRGWCKGPCARRTPPGRRRGWPP